MLSKLNVKELWSLWGLIGQDSQDLIVLDCLDDCKEG